MGGKRRRSVKEEQQNQHLLSQLIKRQYAVNERIYAEGLFVDAVEGNIVILDITENHLIISAAEKDIELGAMMPLSFITISVINHEQRFIQVGFCTNKYQIFRFCEPDDDEAEEIWQEFLKVIELKELSNRITGDFKIQENKEEEDDDDDDYDDSMESASILANYIGFVSDHISGGDFGPEKQSWWNNGFTTPNHRNIEQHIKELMCQDKNEEKKKKEMSVGELFERVHEHHFNMHNGVSSLANRYSPVKSPSNLSNISDWSTSSGGDASSSNTTVESAVKTDKPKKSKSWKKMLIPKAIRSRFKKFKKIKCV